MATHVPTSTYLYTLEWDEEIETVVFTWNEFVAGQQLREGAGDLLELIRSKDASKMIVDASNIEVHDKRDQQWLTEEWLPMIAEAGIEYTATVRKDSPLAEMEMNNLRTRLQEHPITSKIAVDKAEARRWIADQ